VYLDARPILAWGVLMTDDRLRRQYRFTVTPEHLIRDRRISDRAVRLWMLLDRYAGDNGAAFPKRETLAEDLTCSMSTVDRAVTELVDAQWLAKERRSAGDVNVYTLMIAPTSNEPATKRKKRQVKPKGVVTHDERVGVVTHDETPSSPVTRGVVTHDAYKEASLNETQGRIFPAADAPGESHAEVVPLFDARPPVAEVAKPEQVDAGDIVAKWMERHPRTPSQQKGQIAQQSKRLLADGFSPGEIWRAIEAWSGNRCRGQIYTYLDEVQRGRASTTDQRVAVGLSLVQQFAREEGLL
jgi:hypothetical protein